MEGLRRLVQLDQISKLQGEVSKLQGDVSQLLGELTVESNEVSKISTKNQELKGEIILYVAFITPSCVSVLDFRLFVYKDLNRNP